MEERLPPLPTDWAWERVATQERTVRWDGYISYDAVLYGLPAAHLPGHLSFYGRYWALAHFP